MGWARKRRTDTGWQRGNYNRGNRQFAIVGVAGLLLFAWTIYAALTRPPRSSDLPVDLPPAQAVVADANGGLVVPVVNDDQAHFYRFRSSSGREIRFLVVRTPDGTVRTAFDACELCFRQHKGYRLAGDALVCAECRRSTQIADVGAIRACAPAVLPHTGDNSRVVIKASDVESGARYF